MGNDQPGADHPSSSQGTDHAPGRAAGSRPLDSLSAEELRQLVREQSAELERVRESEAHKATPHTGEDVEAVNGLADVAWEIAQRKRAEEAVVRSHDLLVNLARLVPGVIYQYRLYPDGRSAFPYSSPGMNLIYEVTPDEVREDATPVFGRLHPEDYDHVAQAIQESARTLEEFFCEFRVLLPRQGLRWRWSQAHPERTPDGGTLWHGIILDVTDRKMAELALRDSESRARAMLQAMPDLMFRLSRDGVFLDYRAETSDLHAQQELIGRRNRDLTPPDFADLIDTKVADALATGTVQTFEYELPIPGRGVRAYEARMAVSGPDEVTTVVRDITERKQVEAEKAVLEAQLLQAQKMESIGRLAGGVAHDFNNMLGVIMGHAELAMREHSLPPSLREDLEEILHAASRSADLTRQLLAFARRQTVAPRVLDLNETVADMATMLQRLIGEDIRLAWSPRPGLWAVKVDPSQVDQLLANLCVNARDAIAGVGRVSIEVENATFDAAYCALHHGFVPGDYVRLAVSDTGCGMDAETIEHLFEPFFTTKAVGKGTGLGLATVYGIVKQNEGFINVYSEPGHGTTMSVYFPRHAREGETAASGRAETAAVGGTETILVVEDEPAMLGIVAVLLEGLGYRVVSARSPEEALRLAKKHAADLRLLLTDVVMPDMNGRDLANLVLARHPHVKLLFMSGYTADVIARQGVLEEGVLFIEKPFSREVLAQKVREALGRE